VKAVTVRDGRCVLDDAAPPPLLAGTVRIAVAAAGVNRADLAQKAGRYPPPPAESPILGLEVAGVVAEVAGSVDAWRPGDRVCALLAGGGYATEVVVPAGQVLPVPAGLSDVEAAAIVEVAATAWLNVVDVGGLAGRTGARILVHAGGSGVGTAVVQLARALGHRTFVTAGEATKIARCVALGADGGWNRHEGPFRDAVLAWAPDGVDLVIDPVAGPYLADDLAVLAVDGRVVVLGLMGGRTAELDVGRLLMRRLSVIGSTLRSRSPAAKAALCAALRAEVWPRYADGTLRPVVDRTFALAEAEAAHAHLASNTSFGAVVLTVP
jgi:putative PIG3 family NAD(P)H quinone oxidoreductase